MSSSSTQYGVEAHKVWKRFHRGERPTLLSDVIPYFFRRLRHKESPISSKTFWVLKDVSFQVKKGEFLGIVGHNGAGKTTLLKLLAGIMKPSRGSMKVNGRVSSLIIAGAGFHPLFTGRENIYLNASIMGMRKREVDKKIDSIIEFAAYGLPEYKKFLDTPLKQYSSGMLVRLGFAIAAHVEPEVLLVDEILAVGDIGFQQKCLEYMNNLKKKETTVVMVSHNMIHIANYSDRVILLDEGGVVLEGEPANVVGVFEREMAKKMNWVGVGNVPANLPKGWASLQNVQFVAAQRIENALYFDYGCPIVTRFDYNCLLHPLDDITFSLSVYRIADGYKCFTIFSHMYGCSPQIKEGRIELTVASHNLLPGEYVFDVEIQSLRSGIVLAVHRERKVIVGNTPHYLSQQAHGVYQPANIAWSAIP
ncbi:MAG: polysaccharide ABC transporter ATP-binding protein [Candidatus Omnitrophota bacterium]